MVSGGTASDLPLTTETLRHGEAAGEGSFVIVIVIRNLTRLTRTAITITNYDYDYEGIASRDLITNSCGPRPTTPRVCQAVDELSAVGGPHLLVEKKLCRREYDLAEKFICGEGTNPYP